MHDLNLSQEEIEYQPKLRGTISNDCPTIVKSIKAMKVNTEKLLHAERGKRYDN
jgi:hypothetical protein